MKSFEDLVLECVTDAGGCAHHFQFQLFSQSGLVVTRSQVSSALQRLKTKGLVKSHGTYWSAI